MPEFTADQVRRIAKRAFATATRMNRVTHGSFLDPQVLRDDLTANGCCTTKHLRESLTGSVDDLREAIECIDENAGEIIGQHNAECAMSGDSWPGALIQIGRILFWEALYRYAYTELSD